VIARVRLASTLVLLALAVVAPVRAQQGGVGAVRGVVIDADFAVPLARVRVTLVETGASATTSPDGTFALESVAPGTYTMTFAKEGYERVVRSGVIVTAGRLADLRVEMATEVVEMDELVVTGEDFLAGSELQLLDIRQTAVTFQDAISSELISAAGASDVAGAIKFVTGTSVVDGKYATVRGLSDRYVGTTLNGVRVPSADPRRRAVQIDLFPTGTVESVTVTKTFTPDLQGDFTGGGIDIKTKGVPDSRILSVSLSSEWNSLATGNDRFLTYEGGGVSSDARDDGSRALPSLARPGNLPEFTVPRASTRPGIDEANVARAQAYDDLTRSFSDVMGVSTDTPGYNQSLSVVMGNRFDLGKAVLGALGALTWSHKYDLYEGGANRTVTVDASRNLNVDADFDDTRGTDELLIGALGTVVLRPSENHEIALRAIVNRGAEDESRFQFEDDASTDTRLVFEQNQALRYTERELTSYQLHGRHTVPDLIPGRTFGDLDISWTGSDNESSQNEPDVRFFRDVREVNLETGIATSTWPVGSFADATRTRRVFRDIVDDNRQAAVDVALPFTGWSDTEGEVKLGWYSERSDRSYDQISFTYSFPAQLGGNFSEVRRNRGVGTNYSSDDLDLLWTDVFLQPDRIGLAPVRCVPPEWTFRNDCAAPDQLLWVARPVGEDIAYDGTQDITATYAMADLPLSPSWRLIFGARQESTRLSVRPFDPLNPEGDLLTVVVSFTTDETTGRTTINRRLEDTPPAAVATDIDEDAVLPSVGAVWEVRPGMNVRLSWSQTIARPTFRELAPAAAEEFLFGDEFVGNPALKISDIDNWDARWEWFPRPGDVFASSVFYKEIANPIELINFDAGGRFFVQPVNYETGRLRGFEVEARTGLDRIGDRFRHFTVGMNYAWIDSEVDVPRIELDSLSDYDLDEPTRRLQGQPEDLLNVNVTYDNDDIGLSASAFYNRVGATLISGSAKGEFGGIPSIVEQPYETLDVRVAKKLPRGTSLTVKAANLLTPDRERRYETPGAGSEIKTRRETPLKVSVGLSWKW